MATGTAKIQISSTAGAVPIRTQKGGYAMEKVKVTRYIAGKRPEYAQSVSGSSSSESESEDEVSNRRLSAGGATGHHHSSSHYKREEPNSSSRRERAEHSNRPPKSGSSSKSADFTVDPKDLMNDPRMRRLMQRQMSRDDDEDYEGSSRRHVTEPEIIGKSVERSRSSRRTAESSDDEEDDRRPEEFVSRRGGRITAAGGDSAAGGGRNRRRPAESSDEVEEDELPEEELERRRTLIRMRNAAKEKEELLGKAEESDEQSEFEEEEESEYESDSDDDAVQRLKPVFVRKRDRVTLVDNEKEQQKQRELELQKKMSTEERKRQSTKLVEDLVKLEVEMERKKQTEENADLTSVNTDDENEEIAYESWKIRELKRVKRTKEERELHEREKTEIAKIHTMSEEERRAFLRANPKVVTNKQQKGKYKFLQKYYHRGVFYLDNDDEVYKRNFAEATLEDQFDKTVLPKVMQVKDFGKAGRTKWTHLVAEDTTSFESPWVADTAQNIKFFQKHGAGIKDVFDRPALKKRKK